MKKAAQAEGGPMQSPENAACSSYSRLRHQGSWSRGKEASIGGSSRNRIAKPVGSPTPQKRFSFTEWWVALGFEQSNKAPSWI